MHKILLLASIVAIISNSACSTNTPSSSTNNSVPNVSNSISIDSQKEQMLSYINQIRAKGAVCAPPTGTLSWNNTLEQIAQSHVKDMALNDTVTHAGSGTALDPAKSEVGMGSTFIDRIKYFGYSVQAGQLVGENLTRINIKSTKSNKFMPNFKKAIQNIVNDKVHCEIMMNPRFNDIGMAMFKRGNNYYFTMELAERLQSGILNNNKKQ